MVDLDLIEPAPEVLALIPKALAVKVPVLPLAHEDGCILCAVPKGCDESLLSDLEFVVGKPIKSSPVPREKLIEAVSRLYKDVPGNGGNRNAPIDESTVTIREFPGSGVTEGSAVVLANTLISDAVRLGASDIHVEPYETYVRIRYRLDGLLQEISRPSVRAGRTLISRLKIMADLDIAEKRRPQDGRMRVKEDSRTIDIRVSTLPTGFGEKVVLRILDKSRLQLDLAKLGFEENDLRTFQKALKLPHGMILVTGPTGSGKTTTLYAALNYINNPGISITTIEDPIEYNLAGINQTHVRSDIGLTFAAALRSILRQDPNVVMVGEIRDGETAEIAVRAALTGHLVLSTLHTNDAPSAITRLVDMGLEPFLVEASLKLVLAQRLLRRLCPLCKVALKPSQGSLDRLMVGHIVKSTELFAPGQCPACHYMGYSGRTAVYELLRVETGLTKLIVEGGGENMRLPHQVTTHRTLRDAALKKAVHGETSMDEVQRHTF